MAKRIKRASRGTPVPPAEAEQLQAVPKQVDAELPDRTARYDAREYRGTLQKLVAACNKLAGIFYLAHGYRETKAFRFDRSCHPQERSMWNLAAIAYRELTDTDPDDVLEELQELTRVRCTKCGHTATETEFQGERTPIMCPKCRHYRCEDVADDVA